MSSPTLQARRTALSLLLAVLLALALPGLNARADPAPTRIQTNVDADTTGHVRVQGLLLDGSGQGVGGGQLTASVAGQPLQTVTSGGDGAFAMEFNVPADKLSGPQDLVIAYAGDAQYAPTSQSSRIEFAGQSATAVTLEVEPASATPGDPVRVTGSVKAATGGPVSGALVNFSYDGAALSDYTLQTDANGNFDGYVEIPETAAVGEGKLVATFVGAAGLPAGSAEKQITIEAPAPASSPTPTEGESTQGAAPPVPSPTASTRGPIGTGSPSAGTAQSESRGDSLLWLLIGGGVVAVAAAALVVLGLIVRSRRREADEGTLGLIGDGELLDDELPEDAMDPEPELELNDGTEVRLSSDDDQALRDDAAEGVEPRQETRTMPLGWFREGEGVPSPELRAPGEDWDDFTDSEITQVRLRDEESPQEPQPRRGGEPRPRRGI